ncbi:MAG: hypothetical protein APF83_08785 [Lutibacter sp. BRH_c52]|nr:MAG: hypothetical protein APF83_08785 [Lutibacter sp. BRH_c52]
MHRYPSNLRAKILTTYQDILIALEDAKKLSRAAGMNQRNAVISHVNSKYTQHENVLEKSKICEDLFFRIKILTALSEKLKDPIDFLSNHLKYKQMIQELDVLIIQSVQSENYETAAILKKCRDTFLEPK